MNSQIFILFISAIVSFLLTYPIAWVLTFLHLNQTIRAEGPQTHQTKAGTPTMGGIGFVVTILAFSLIFINFDLDWRYLALIIMIFGFALVGFADDLLKIVRKQNLGLTFWQKIAVQTALAAAFSLFLIVLGHHNLTSGFLKILWFANPVLFFLLSTFIIVGTANATNLTDGLNGLLAGTGGIAFLSFALLARKLLIYDATTFCFIAAGAVLVFLFYNFPKAKVFMGDVGSLAIGAALAGIAIIIHKELRLMVIGGVFLVEALSVILQVAAYKLWKKRILRMAPLHHHFELLGFGEMPIVIGFWVAVVILGLIGVWF
ncbi:MAG: phospho-N-acetylmuramoyl-pentapeptide-transferase [Candidatus Margulisbacteria bacterium]|nr:phospho-N-acetylmuramoyl-pentapeptide-transferase [Candidatus Margulisiibacteriota bacterium]